MLDVLRKLGNANKECSRPRQGTKAPLHFLNYLELGIDLGFGETDQKLKKIICRANQLADPIFGFYDRCNFQLPLQPDDRSDEEERKDAPKFSSFEAELVVTPQTKFSAVKHALS